MLYMTWINVVISRTATTSTMFSALEAAKLGHNKLLLLFVVLYISPLSQEQQIQQQSETYDRDQATAPSSSLADNLIEKRNFELTFESFTCTTNNNDDEDDSRLNASTIADSASSSSAPSQTNALRKIACLLNRNIRRRYLKMEMSFERQINQFEFDILITMQRGGAFEPQPFVLVNLTAINGCKFLAQKKQVTLMALARKNLDRYSNYPRNCPLSPFVSYYIHNFRWDLEQMPAFFLESPVHIEFEYRFDSATILKGVIEAKVGLKQNKKFFNDL